MLNEILNGISPYLWQILGVIVTALCSYLGLKFKTIYERKVNTETKQKIVETVVKWIEQIAKENNWTSTDKLKMAKENVIALVNQSGLTITELELNALIESACKSFTTSSK